ncbi:3-methyl-2-oxobutanoate hydroxymethyltransferase [Nibricoccus sp. IMCC34717]|uniref:3-methyl-2-oxobutanoate hydroxymethyltransferase n=1 Tax=Nibricoccus sp. IMCC34717 TaxID=3034021 RepID=UPI00384DFAE5
MAKTTTHTLRKIKGQRPIVAVTSYDALMTRLADEAGVDIILVGDSVGNILLGFDSTVPVTLDMMCHHTAAVARAKPAALVAADVPFAEAHYEFEKVLRACQRLIQESGAEAVKIEGGAALAPMVARLVDAGVPVWAHIGLRPQQVHALGRYRKFGATAAEADQMRADARALTEAGAFALLLEMTDPAVAKAITDENAIPTIGIGAGPDCDGQVLVYTDFLGLTPGYVPAFARQFADAGKPIREGLAGYVDAVRNRRFP